MNYNDTIIKNPTNKKYHIRVDLKDLWKYQTVMEMEEDVWDWNLGERVDNLDYVDIEQAKDYLMGKVKGINNKLINKFSDTLESDVMRACVNALEYSYMTEFKNWFLDNAMEQLSNTGELLDFKTYFYSSEYKEYHKEFVYNTDEIILVSTKENAKKFYKEHNDYEDLKFSELGYDLSEYFEVDKLNTEHFDYYGTAGDYDNWLESFIDYNEIENEIKEYLEKKTKQTKAYILNKVDLFKRLK